MIMAGIALLGLPTSVVFFLPPQKLKRTIQAGEVLGLAVSEWNQYWTTCPSPGDRADFPPNLGKWLLVYATTLMKSSFFRKYGKVREYYSWGKAENRRCALTPRSRHHLLSSFGSFCSHGLFTPLSSQRLHRLSGCLSGVIFKIPRNELGTYLDPFCSANLLS